MEPIDAMRAEFPVCREHIYLNHAAVSPLPLGCTRAMGRYLDELSAHGAARGMGPLLALLDAVRGAGARLLGARPDQIFVVRSTTQGLSIPALGLDWRAGDNLVLIEHEFPANQRLWQPLGRRGVELRYVPSRGGRVALDELAARVDGRTRLVAVSFVQFHTGLRLDLAAVADICRSHDAMCCVDAIQGLGAFALDAAASGVDFVSADAHKWLLGPEGVGLGFCSDRALGRIAPALEGWLAVERPFDFYDLEQPLKPTAARFEDSAYNSAGLAGLSGSLALIERFGLDAIAARILELTDRLADGLEALGWSVLSPRQHQAEKSGVLSALPPGDARALLERLSAAGVVASLRDFPDGRRALRFSPHAYNTLDEIEQVLSILGSGLPT